MNAGELRRLLELLPDDTTILVKGVHVQYLYRYGAGNYPVTASSRPCECGRGSVKETEHVPVGPAISIDHTIWYVSRGREAPRVDLHGRWPRAAKRDRVWEDSLAGAFLRGEAEANS